MYLPRTDCDTFSDINICLLCNVSLACPGWRQGGASLRHSGPLLRAFLQVVVSLSQHGFPPSQSSISIRWVLLSSPLLLAWPCTCTYTLFIWFRLQEMQRTELGSSDQYSGKSGGKFWYFQLWKYFRKKPNLFYFLSYDLVWLFSQCRSWYLWWLSSVILSWSFLKIFQRTSDPSQGMCLTSCIQLNMNITMNNEV